MLPFKSANPKVQVVIQGDASDLYASYSDGDYDDYDPQDYDESDLPADFFDTYNEIHMN